MSDLRYDPIFGQWVVIAENRNSRPVEFQQFSQRRAGIDCPFCKGNESVTPPAIEQWSVRGPLTADESDWLVRVVPNKYPAMDSTLLVRGIRGDNPPPSSGAERHPTDMAETPTAWTPQLADDNGFQEVIVLSPRHVVSLSGLNNDELCTGFAAFQNRVAFHNRRSGIAHVCLFMNCRPLAGASIEHSHFQLIASPVCTDQVRSRIARMMEQGPGPDGDTAWQKLLRWEAEAGDRIVAETGRFLVFCPYASRYSSQIRIAPRQGGPFPALDAAARDELARLCRQWIDGIERCLDDPAYNLVFHLPPTDQPDAAWFVDLIPRFPQAAGFELATDCWVNPVAPESAASQFRRFAASRNTSHT
jgi:UDPglucose--hexose-1-phosphate uridylyltransferase